MELAVATLCDYASVREGLIFVHAGGVTRLWRDEYPAKMGVHLALVFQLHRMELGRPHEVDVRIMGQDAEVAHVKIGFQADMPADLNIAETVQLPAPVDLSGVEIPQQGPYSVEIAVDGTHLRSLTFRASPRTPAR